MAQNAMARQIVSASVLTDAEFLLAFKNNPEALIGINTDMMKKGGIQKPSWSTAEEPRLTGKMAAYLLHSVKPTLKMLTWRRNRD